MDAGIDKLREEIKQNGIAFIDTDQSIGEDVNRCLSKPIARYVHMNLDERQESGRELTELATKYSSHHTVVPRLIESFGETEIEILAYKYYYVGEGADTAKSSPSLSANASFLGPPSKTNNTENGWYSWIWMDQPSPPALFVVLFESNSQIAWGSQTHVQKLERRHDVRNLGLLETPDHCMKDIPQEEADLPAGGLAIIDGRLIYKLRRGGAIYLGIPLGPKIREWLKGRPS